MPPPPPQLNAVRLKTTLKMAISKLKFLQEKKSAIAKQQRRQLADLLSAGKETSAKIRVENIIRDDIAVELMEFCELYCELLLARVQIVLDMHRNETEGGLKEAILSIIYCCSYTEITELTTLGDLLKIRYGAEYAHRVLENTDFEYVPEKITKRCDVMPPAEELVDMYLIEIARTYEVPYSGLPVETLDVDTSNPDEDNDDDDTDGGSGGVGELEAPLAAADSVPKVAAKSRPASAPKKKVDDFDDLRARFAALKR